jgi:hypothetical protein
LAADPRRPVRAGAHDRRGTAGRDRRATAVRAPCTCACGDRLTGCRWLAVQRCRRYPLRGDTHAGANDTRGGDTHAGANDARGGDTRDIDTRDIDTRDIDTRDIDTRDTGGRDGGTPD